MKYPWPITLKKKINSSSNDLWKLISEPEHLNLVHPFCRSNEIIVWNEKEHKDVLVYLNGLIYFREFIVWDENKGYKLLIGRKRGKKSKVEWKITTQNNSVFLSITVYSYLLNSWPRLISYFPYILFIKPVLKKYLSSVIGGINWYLTNDKPIPKNHFGKHMWFSKY